MTDIDILPPHIREAEEDRPDTAWGPRDALYDENTRLREALAALRQRYNDKDTEMRGVLADIDERDATIRDLRQRHAEAVERAFREGFINFDGFGSSETDAAWLASEAKEGLV